MLLLFLWSVAAWAGDPAPRAQTTADPHIPVDELVLRLQPLTKDELRVEAEAWRDLLKAKVKELSDAEIAVRYERREIEAAEEVEAAESGAETDARVVRAAREAERDIERRARRDQAVSEARENALAEAHGKGEPDRAGATAVETKKDTKERLLEHINTLRAERTVLIDRLNAVVDAWEEKGGDKERIEEYRKYIAAVSGIELDVSDVDATWATVKGWILSDQGGLRWARNIAAFLLTVAAFYLLSRLLGNATSRAFRATRAGSTLLRDFTVKGVRRATLLIGVIVGLGTLEVNIGPLLAVIGAVGFVIALALQNSLSNFASGILILLYRPFDVDDVIEAAGVSGKVEAVTLLSTHIRTFDNKSMILPNNEVWGGVITNATGTDKRRVDMVFGIGYDDSIPDALRVLEEIVSAHELVLKDPEPVIRLHELGESSVNFICRPWARPADYWTVYWDITRAVKERFDAEGISIPYPQRDVHVYHETPPGPALAAGDGRLSGRASGTGRDAASRGLDDEDEDGDVGRDA
jgi:small conductance mechanosensitive channel